MPASGAVTVEAGGGPVTSSPLGVSLDRHRGRRVGEVQLAVLAESPGEPIGLDEPVSWRAFTWGEDGIVRGRCVAPRAGTLYLRVNARPDRRALSSGSFPVTLTPGE